MLARGLVSSLTQILDTHRVIRALRPVVSVAPAVMLLIQLPLFAYRIGYGAVRTLLSVSVGLQLC